MICQRSYYLVKITNVLDHIFLEYKAFFDNILGATAIFIIKTYNSADDVANIPDEKYVDIHNVSSGKFTLPKFHKLKSIEKKSIGESNIYLQNQLLTLINLYENMCY